MLGFFVIKIRLSLLLDNDEFLLMTQKINNRNFYIIPLLIIYSYFAWKWGMNQDTHGFLLMGVFFLSLFLILLFISIFLFHKFYRKKEIYAYLLYALIVLIVLIIVYLLRVV